MKKKIYYISYFLICLCLVFLSIVLTYYLPFTLKVSSSLENTLLITNYLLTISIPGKNLLLGGDVITSGVINVSTISSSYLITIDNISYSTFNMDYITIGILLLSILIFITSMFFIKKSIPGFIFGGIEIILGISLFFQIYYFLYFNKDVFNNSSTYIEGINFNYSYLTLGSYIGGGLLIILGIIIIINSIINKKKIKK